VVARGGGEMFRKIRGQSTLEYILVFTAIVAAVIAGAVIMTGPKNDSTSGLGKLMKQAGSSIEGASTRAKNVIPTS
jgi:uncharacterized protein (UPF0333 family)